MNGFNLIIKPDQEDIEAAEVLVDGTIGSNEYRFLLDTGAARTCVRFDDYTSTFESLGKNNSSGVFAKSSDDLITVPNIELGPISKKDLTVVRLPEETQDVRNLIGMDFLKDFCCHFLFDQNQVLIDSDSVTEGNVTFQELFCDSKFHPYVDVEFGDVEDGDFEAPKLTARTVWDTGAGITIADLNFIKKYPGFFEEVGRSQGTDSTGFTMETSTFIMGPTLIGGKEFGPHKVAGVDLSAVNATIEVPMNLILGYSTLSKANWWFDFPGKKWAITKLLSVK